MMIMIIIMTMMIIMIMNKFRINQTSKLPCFGKPEPEQIRKGYV